MKVNDKAVGLAALLSAGLASVCCIGPLAVAGLGLGGLGLAAGLSKYRPVFLIVTAAVLALGFYRAYRKRDAACSDGTCKVRSGAPAMRPLLWGVTALAAALATFPNWSARALSHGPAPAPEGAQVLNFRIAGMDCAACAASIESAIAKVPGVRSARVDFDAGSARVFTAPGVGTEAILNAVEVSGYKAEVGPDASGKTGS